MQRSRCINGKPPPAAIFPSHVRPTSTHIFVLVTGIYYLVLIDPFYIFCQFLWLYCFFTRFKDQGKRLVRYLGNDIYQDVISCQSDAYIMVTPTDVLLLPISNQIEEKKQNAKAETWILV